MATLARPASETAQDPARPEIGKEQSNLLVNPRAYGDGRLRQMFADLRRENPLSLARPDGFEPFWVVTRQADLRAIAMNADDFRNGGHPLVLTSNAAQDQMRTMLDGRNFPVRPLPFMDKPDHPVYRAVASEFFHARTLDKLTDQIRATAAEFVDHMLSFGGSCDFVKDVAYLYPLRVVMQIMGVPIEDEPLMLRLAKEFGGSEDPEVSGDGVGLSDAELGRKMVETIAEMNAYFDAMMADRRANPRNDLVSVIANAQIDGKPMPALESRSYCFIAATAGHDTTAGVTAGGMLALCEHPGLLDEIRGNPDKVKAFVEEAIRLYTPVIQLMRTAARDVEMNGRQIRAGEWISLAFASANRDEAVYEDPEVFRIDRRPNKLVSFGNGPHVCLGQHLARLEMRLLFEELARNVESVELAGEPKVLSSLQIAGHKSMPIRFTPRKG